MNNKSFANKAIITTTALAISFILLMGPTSMTLDVFAQGNSLNQGIGQSQASTQLGICVSGDGTLISCNNLSVQDQDNEGNNAALQSGGNDDDDDDAVATVLTKASANHKNQNKVHYVFLVKGHSYHVTT